MINMQANISTINNTMNININVILLYPHFVKCIISFMKSTIVPIPIHITNIMKKVLINFQITLIIIPPFP